MAVLLCRLSLCSGWRLGRCVDGVYRNILYITSYYTLISKRLVKFKSFRKFAEVLDSLTSRVQASLFLL